MAADPSRSELKEAEFVATEATLRASGRGRLFLDEFRRRSRSDELAVLLATVETMQGREKAAPASPPPDRIVEAPEADPFPREALTAISEAAERLQDLTWTLREQGADSSLCDMIEQQSREIVAACSRIEADPRKNGDGTGKILPADSAPEHAASDQGPGRRAEPNAQDGKLSVADAFAAVEAPSTREKLALIS